MSDILENFGNGTWIASFGPDPKTGKYKSENKFIFYKDYLKYEDLPDVAKAPETREAYDKVWANINKGRKYQKGYLIDNLGDFIEYWELGYHFYLYHKFCHNDWIAHFHLKSIERYIQLNAIYLALKIERKEDPKCPKRK